MAHEGLFATSAEINFKAGAGVAAGAIVEARINELCKQVESTINAVTRFNWSDAYAGLNVDVKGLLSEAASNLVAIYMIIYDMSGYTTRVEAEDMINVLRDGALRALSLLRDKKVKEFVDKA